MKLEIGPYSINVGRQNRHKRNAENPSNALTHQTIIGEAWPSGGSVLSGEAAMAVSAVLACVRVIAESIASLSWIVYRRVDGRGKDRAPEHYAYDILHTRANPIMTAFSFRERLIKDALLHGNGYAYIEYGRHGRIEGLWPLNPYAVTPELDPDGRGLRYRIRSSHGFDGVYQPGFIMHVPCLGDGIVGRSVVSYSAGAVGLSADVEEYARTFFSNGAYAGGLLESPKPLSADAKNRLREGWSSTYGRNAGSTGWHRVAVIEDGITWKPMTVSPRDAMAIESRKYQVEEIARMFRVPPHMIADLNRSTNNNIEHQGLEFVQHTCMPWLVRVEQEANYKLFSAEERGTFFSEFLIDSLLRGDIKSRNEAYQIMRRNGVLNADEWRERENLNPLPDGQGQKYIVEQNMQGLDQVGEEGESDE